MQRGRTAVLAAALGGGAAVALTSSGSEQATATSGVKHVATSAGDLKDLGLNIVVAILVWAVIALIPYVGYRIIKARTSRQLVLEPAVDATGGDGLGTAAPGLTSIAAESLVPALRSISETIQKTKDRTGFSISPSTQIPLDPRRSPDTTLSELIDSVGTVFGDTGGGAAAAIGKALVRQSGTQVTPTFQSRSDTPNLVGVTFAIADLQDAGAPESFTLWYPRPDASPEPSPIRDPHKARAHLAAGRILKELHRYDDQLHHLARAATLDPEEKGIADVAAWAQVGSNALKASKAAFAKGNEERDRLELAQAARTFAGGWPPDQQAGMVERWSLALGQDGGRGGALLGLAEQYWAAGLHDEAEDLFDWATEAGAAEAELSRRHHREARAAELLKAARGLTQADAVAATALAKEALELHPGFAGAGEILHQISMGDTKWLAEFDVPQPADPSATETGGATGSSASDAGTIAGASASDAGKQGDATPSDDGGGAGAAASLGLAADYESVGDHQNAGLQYLEVLKKQPDDAQAKEGFVRTLSQPRSLSDQLLKLLPHAADLLALQLFRREFVRDQTRWQWARISPLDGLAQGWGAAIEAERRKHEGLVRNYIGMLIQAYADEPVTVAMLKMAAEEFKQAAQLIPRFFQPVENLAEARFALALIAPARSDRRARAGEALLGYAEALRILRAAPLQQASADVRRAERRLLASEAAAAYLTEDDDDLRTTGALMTAATCDHDDKAEQDARLLGTLASVYGLAVNRKRDLDEARQRGDRHEEIAGEFGAGKSKKDLRRAGRRLMAYCMGRAFDEEWWQEIEDLELFKGLREGDGLPKLQRRLRAKVAEDPCFPISSATSFCAVVDGLLVEIGWT